MGEVWFEAPGDPELLIKYLFTSEKLSVQVHPDDAYARAHGHERGKDEAWLILAADPHATIAIGTQDVMTKEALRASALDGTIEDRLKWWSVKADEVYHSPAGTVHAIGPGLTVIEVQQNVDLTYRLYDYGSARELHLDDGIAVADPVPYVATHVARDLAPGRRLLAEGPKFVMERWASARGTVAAPNGKPVWLIPVKGGGTVDGAPLEAGGVWMAEGETALTIAEGGDVLVAYPGGEAAEGVWTTA